MELRLQDTLDCGRAWHVGIASDELYEVHLYPSAFVDIKDLTCSCGEWQHNCFPCTHAAQ